MLYDYLNAKDLDNESFAQIVNVIHYIPDNENVFKYKTLPDELTIDAIKQKMRPLLQVCKQGHMLDNPSLSEQWKAIPLKFRNINIFRWYNEDKLFDYQTF